jgi:hypothetical protein
VDTRGPVHYSLVEGNMRSSGYQGACSLLPGGREHEEQWIPGGLFITPCWRETGQPVDTRGHVHYSLLEATGEQPVDTRGPVHYSLVGGNMRSSGYQGHVHYSLLEATGEQPVDIRGPVHYSLVGGNMRSSGYLSNTLSWQSASGCL